jgi:hypothetical protein
MSTTTKLVAYHGDPAIKAQYLERVRAHRAADELVKGQYWEEGKGCAVGCTIHGNDHSRYETELGIPREVAQLEDSIFEGLPNGQALRWPERFLAAIQPGADLSLVWPRFAAWLLVDPTDGVIRFARTDREREAIEAVAALHERVVAGDSPRRDEWDAAGAAARDAAGATARAAARAAAWAAARAAAGAAAGDSLKPTTEWLQKSAADLVVRMCELRP